MPSDFKHKETAIKRIKSKLPRLGIDALAVSAQSNIEYLTPLYAGGALLLIARKGPPLYFVDSMNKTLAERELAGSRLIVLACAGPVLESFAECIKDKNIKKLGFNGEDFSLAGYKRLSSLIPKVKLIDKSRGVQISSVLKDLRSIKHPDEVKLIRTIARETVRLWRRVKKSIRTGMSEKEIASVIDMHIYRKGYERSFPTIVAIGKNSAYPHATPGGRRLKGGEHVLVDFGMRQEGYCSDLTRIYYKGRINRKIGRFHECVRKARDFAIKSIAPGVKISSVAEGVNNIFINNKFQDYILHGLGHGVGLDIHEEPSLSQKCHDKFREGMVITVEPGLYKPGLGGIRIEDMVLVTSKGCEVLTV